MKKRQRGSSRVREAYWRRWMARWEASGMSQRAFCLRKRLSLWKFLWWRYRLAKLKSPGRSKRGVSGGKLGPFIPVRVRPARAPGLEAPERSGGWACEIAFPGGARVRLRERPGAAELREWLGATAAAPAP